VVVPQRELASYGLQYVTFKIMVLLAKENLKSARATRNEIRETVFEEVAMDEDRAPLTSPIVSKKRKVRSINK
jgi:hypothetical protein